MRSVKRSLKIFLIFLEFLTRSWHHLLGALVEVIGSERSKGEGEFWKLLLNGHFENSLPFFVVGSERCPKVHQKIIIFIENSERLCHYTLGAFVRVIGSERWQEGVGGLKRVCCFEFFSSVLTQFAISFQDRHYFLPNFDRPSLFVVGERGTGSRLVIQLGTVPPRKIFVVGSERCPNVHQKFLIFLETSARSYHHTLGAFVRVIIVSERWQEMTRGLRQVRCFVF